MTVPPLRFPSENVERRVLAHLPVYRTQKEHKVAERLETKGDEKLGIEPQNKVDYVISYTVPEMVGRLQADDELKRDLANRIVAAGGAEGLLEALQSFKERSSSLDEFWDAIVSYLESSGLLPAVNTAFVRSELDKLRERGYAEVFTEDQDLPSDEQRWRMTKNGLTALTAEQE